MNKTMLGYDLSCSSDELYTEYQRKLLQAADKDEIHFGYMLISDPQFIQTFQGSFQEGWKYLKKSMKIPPTILLESCIDTCKNHLSLQLPTYKKRKKKQIHCFLCPEHLCDSMCDKIKFLEIKCSCKKMYTHINCGNNFIINNALCTQCKQYYDVNQYCSSLRSILT